MRRGRLQVLKSGLPKAFAILVAVLCANQTAAQTCPGFYRFVDFGQTGRDGAIYRGGPTFRAESFSGDPILIVQRTECLEVADISKDGRGNPIPVVTRISYDPSATNVDLTELTVSIVGDVLAAATDNAQGHLERMQRTDTEVTRGSKFLCARPRMSTELSCQLQAPYPGNIALVVYCDALQCRMPVMAIKARLQVSAVWPRHQSTLTAPGEEGGVLVEKVQEIHDFLAPLSSDF